MTHWTDDLEFTFPNSAIQPRPKAVESPYYGIDPSEWEARTRQLLREHPLDDGILRNAVLTSWNDIFASQIGPGRFGVDFRPAAQVMGNLLHELIPLRVSQMASGWRRNTISAEKDLVFEPDDSMSMEIKTSSDARWIYGNRSYGVEQSAPGRKAKSGFYLAVNFDKWPASSAVRPEIKYIRFGWIDSTDWRAQVAQTGQNSSLPSLVYAKQLPLIYVRP